MSRLLSINGAAKELGIARSTLRGWVADRRVSTTRGKIPSHTLSRVRELAELRGIERDTGDVSESARTPVEPADENNAVGRMKFAQDVLAAALPVLELDDAPGFPYLKALHASLWAFSEMLTVYGACSPANAEEAETGARCIAIGSVLARAAHDLAAVVNDGHSVETERLATELEKRAVAIDGPNRGHLENAAAALRKTTTTRGDRSRKKERS